MQLNGLHQVLAGGVRIRFAVDQVDKLRRLEGETLASKLTHRPWFHRKFTAGSPQFSNLTP
jgi:hypothetical protein